MSDQKLWLFYNLYEIKYVEVSPPIDDETIEDVNSYQPSAYNTANIVARTLEDACTELTAIIRNLSDGAQEGIVISCTRIHSVDGIRMKGATHGNSPC